jgi:SH3-like domain-containing protein
MVVSSDTALVRRALTAMVALAMTAVTAAAEGQVGSKTGLPIPRFVSLRSDEVNLRAGPGTTYPVEWVYVRRGMPIEVIAEFENWRKVRDWQGTVGWVHQSLLDGRRTVLVVGEERLLRQEPAADAPALARLEPGVIAGLLECSDLWCRIEIEGHRGWLGREEFWGTYPAETIK